MKTICLVAVSAALLQNAVPSAAHQASIGGLQDAYKTVCQWSVDAYPDSPTSKRPGAEARWNIRVKSLRESLENKSVQLGRLPIVARNIKADKNDEATNRASTYVVSAGSNAAFAVLGMKLLMSGGMPVRSDTYAQVENQVCMLRLTLTDRSGRLAGITTNATIEGSARIDKALFGAYGVTFEMALSDWTVAPPR